ncbi:MAG: hypothetical protein HFH59_09400 [Lachnospiraceae bacterium]|nr:hypothetical protein [Lachnospiraceae bacterium]
MREANLQSQAVRERMERDAKVKHFKAEAGTDNEYGKVWGDVVRAYLTGSYTSMETSFDLKVEGTMYGVLRRNKNTAFYDADGNTLFDVENGRLDREYRQLMDASKEPGTETGCQIKKQIEETGEKDLKCSGGIDEKCTDCDKAADSEGKEVGQEMVADPKTMEGDRAGDGVPAGEAGTAGKVSAKQEAKEKLEKDLEGDKDKSFAEPVIGYLLGRCAEDEGLSQDVVQEHKTWKKCIDYIYEKARKQSVGNKAAIRDDVVYEWAEDYYHKDDKAEEEEKARKEAERKEKQKKAAAERAAKAKKKSSKAVTAPEKKADAPKEQPKPKKNNRDMDGQLDMFSMMGM